MQTNPAVDGDSGLRLNTVTGNSFRGCFSLVPSVAFLPSISAPYLHFPLSYPALTWPLKSSYGIWGALLASLRMGERHFQLSVTFSGCLKH